MINPIFPIRPRNKKNRSYGIDGIDFDDGAKPVGTETFDASSIRGQARLAPQLPHTSPRPQRPPRETSSSRAETINETFDQSEQSNNRSIRTIRTIEQ
ncbi:MAG: hypothetical protein MJ249_11235, partial [Kiritimatiellae bacterium]|nr:hypothetical protein [Kiritimatiellia bacterium]